ncbi:hypothetical protein BDM02DRAFT_2068285 [Thelephora ganbajun]|uniref:Uncharacterized protein n=1 Tax=Thelephora ganbajun TaxID=370292 RepID=A0ACB6ZGL6_THEGA|nr:hypothetical protein BDM02DRAFT_2068285 [Thelephora ganbajun]
MAPQPIHILSRTDDSGSSNTPLYIAGFSVAGVIAIGAAIWLTIRFLRKRARERDEDNRGAAFLNVRGLVREDDEKREDESFPSGIHAIQSRTFSRAHIDAQGIVMPSRALTRPNTTKQEILDHHANEGNLPRPFAPFSFALQAGTTPPVEKRGSTASVLTVSRDSFLSLYSHSSRFSTASTISSSSQSNRRKVQQLFDPVLPDELVVSLGERLTVMQSFDDGWCIVGRPGMVNKDDIELGAVPAWCFLKTVKGLRAERPMRIDSLGITVQLDAPNPGRDQVMSWSNF